MLLSLITGHGTEARKPATALAGCYLKTDILMGSLDVLIFLPRKAKFLEWPVDVVVAPDGSLLISDDNGNKIYRLSWKGGK